MKKYQLVGEIWDFDYVSETYGYRICGPASLKKFLADCADGEKVEIEINSPGGLCIPGMEMANAIKNSKAHVIAHITGMAASMASVIACACDEIKIEEAAFMMIHDPWSGIEGNAAAMRKEAQNLDQYKAVIMSFYRGKFNRTPEELSALMSDETWMTGAECVEQGLKCELIKSDVKIAALVGMASFAKMPTAAADFYRPLSDDARAEFDAAVKANATATAAPAAPANAAPAPVATAPAAAPAPESSPSQASASTDWEARYKGASKKINELTAALAAASETADAAAAKALADATKIADLTALVTDLQSKLDQRDKDLADATASVSNLKSEIDSAKQALAQMSEQAEHLKNVNATITGGVLIPSAEASEYEAKMKKAKSARERENLRALKKAGKIN